MSYSAEAQSTDYWVVDQFESGGVEFDLLDTRSQLWNNFLIPSNRSHAAIRKSAQKPKRV